MKKNLLLILLFVSSVAFGQNSTLINYQGIARDAAGQPMASATLAIRFELLQGAGTPSTAFTEVQTVITNSLGLFTTQIGKQTTNGLNAVNFEAGALQLRVSMDPNGGSSFTTLGTQSLVSVPYSMHAASVPATYSNNVLTVGKKSFTLADGATYSAGNSNITITGTSPNYSISSSPSLSIIAPGTMSITNGNTVSIDPSLSFSNNVLTVGAPSNSIVLSSSLAATSIQGGGAAAVSTLAINSFSVNVPTTNITPSTNVSVQGTFPNYTIASTPSLSFSSNVLSISGGNSIPLPPGTLAGTGAANVTTVSPGNFIVNVPAITLTPSTNISVTGSWPSFSVAAIPTLGVGGGSISINGGNSVALPVQSISGAGVATVSGAPNYVVNVNATNISMTNTGLATSISTVSANNFNINVPLNHITMSNTSTAVGITTVAANNYNINVPSPNIAVTQTAAAAASVGTVSSNNYNINVPTPNITITSSVAAAGINTTSTNNYNINIPSPNISVTNTSAAVGVSTVSANNYNINVPSPNITVSNTFAAVGINTTALNNYNINIPSPNISVTNTSAAVGISTVSTNNYNINVPSPNISVTNTSAAVGISTVSTNNYNINVPSPNISVTNFTGAASVNTLSTNNYSINIPLPTIAATGLATQTTVGSSFTVAVPVWTYTNTTGVIGSGTNTLNITPALTVNANTLTIGSNSTTITGLLAGGTTNYLPKWNNATSLTGTSLLFDDGTNVGIGTTSPAQKLDVTGYIRVGAGTGSSNEGWILASPSPGFSSLIAGGRATTDARIVQSNNAPLSFHTNNNEKMRLDGAGNLAIGSLTAGILSGAQRYLTVSSGSVYTGASTALEIVGASTAIATPIGKLDFLSVGPTGTFNNIGRISSHRTGGTNTGYLAFYTNNGGGITEQMRLDEDGNFGIGTTSPAQKLDVTGSIRVASGLSAANEAWLLSTPGAGTAVIAAGGRASTEARFNQTNNGIMTFFTNNTERMRIASNGAIGIGDGNDEKIAFLPTNGNMLFTDPLGSITFTTISGASNGMINIFSGGTTNADRMVIQHSPAYPTYGLQYSDASDKFNFIGSGSPVLTADLASLRVGVGTTSPTEKLDVIGNVQIPAANDYQYATNRTAYVSVSAAAFTPIQGLTLGGTGTGNARYIFNGTTGLAADMFADLQLPNSATITAIDVYVYDLDGGLNINAELVGFNMAGNVISTIVTLPSTVGSPGLTAISATGLTTVVNTNSFSYFIKFNTYQATSNLWIRGAKVTYVVNKVD